MLSSFQKYDASAFHQLQHLTTYSLYGELVDDLYAYYGPTELADRYDITEEEVAERLLAVDEGDDILGAQLWAEEKPFLSDVIMELAKLRPNLSSLHCYLDWKDESNSENEDEDELADLSKLSPPLWIWKFLWRHKKRSELLASNEVEWSGRGRFSPRWHPFRTLVGTAREMQCQKNE